MTTYEKTVVTAYTGVFMCSIDDLQAYTKQKLGIDTVTTDFVRPELMFRLKQAAKQDFLDICAGPILRCGRCRHWANAHNDGKMYCMRPIRGDDYAENGNMYPLEVEMLETDFCSCAEPVEQAPAKDDTTQPVYTAYAYDKDADVYVELFQATDKQTAADICLILTEALRNEKIRNDNGRFDADVGEPCDWIELREPGKKPGIFA